MINKIQSERAFYFSYDIDLTKNVQRTLKDIHTLPSESTTEDLSNSKYKNNQLMRDAYPNSVEYIPHFAFNDQLLKEFQGLEYSPFRVPCIFGYVFLSSPVFKSGAKTDFSLISRKDCRRPGRRFITRGLDPEGNAANFVETEHIFVHNKEGGQMSVASFV